MENTEKIIYLDNAATTRTLPEAVTAMLPWFSEHYGNASSIYRLGAEAKQAIAEARETIAGSLNAQPREIYFTAGGSEADNWALVAAADTSSLPQLSIMPCFIPAAIWKREALSLPI